MSVWWWGAPQYVSSCCVMSWQQRDIISQLWSDTTPIYIYVSMYYTLILLHMYLLCFKACHVINIIKANSRTSRFDGGKNRGWLFNEYGDPILVRSVSPCWLQESNVSLLLWPSSISTWGDVIDLALEKALKKHILSEDVDASKRYWLRRGSGGNIQGYNSSSIHCYC